MTHWVEFRSETCPVCGHRDRCKHHPDRGRDLVMCFRCSDDHVGEYRKQGETKSECTIYVREGAPADGRRKVQRGNGHATPRNPALDASRFKAGATETAVAELAAELRVDRDALLHLEPGFDGNYASFPERDATGRIIANCRRFPDGSKRVQSGERRGLIIPDNLAELPDPVLIVEGASDVAACLTMGLAAVGRPNNTFGADLLARLLVDREILIVGENDLKPDGAHPGREGAEKVAAELANAWSKPVSWALPPDRIKDVRDFLQQHGQDAGPELLKALRSRCVTVRSALDELLEQIDADPDNAIERIFSHDALDTFARLGFAKYEAVRARLKGVRELRLPKLDKAVGVAQQEIAEREKPRLSEIAERFVQEHIQPQFHRDGRTVYSQGEGRELHVAQAYYVADDSWLDAAAETREAAGCNRRALISLVQQAVTMALARRIRSLPNVTDVESDPTVESADLLDRLAAVLLDQYASVTTHGTRTQESIIGWARGIEPGSGYLQFHTYPVFGRVDVPGTAPTIAIQGSWLRQKLRADSNKKLAAELRSAGLADTDTTIAVAGSRYRVWVLTPAVTGFINPTEAE